MWHRSLILRFALLHPVFRILATNMNDNGATFFSCSVCYIGTIATVALTTLHIGQTTQRRKLPVRSSTREIFFCWKFAQKATTPLKKATMLLLHISHKWCIFPMASGGNYMCVAWQKKPTAAEQLVVVVPGCALKLFFSKKKSNSRPFYEKESCLTREVRERKKCRRGGGGERVNLCKWLLVFFWVPGTEERALWNQNKSCHDTTGFEKKGFLKED